LGVPLENIVVYDGNGGTTLDGVTGCWLTEGSKRRLLQMFVCDDGTYTETRELVRHIYESGGAVGGSSAGAAVMGDVMVAGGDSHSALNYNAEWGYDGYSDLTKNRLRITKGAGIFPAGPIDRHFNVKPRFFRLVEAVMLTRDINNAEGFGIFEDTALIYDGPSQVISVIGCGAVYMVDCFAAVRLGEPGAYKYTGIKTAKLYESDTYDTVSRKVSLSGKGFVDRDVTLSLDYQNLEGLGIDALIHNELFPGQRDNPSFYDVILNVKPLIG
jgi:cyanophycinase